MIRAEFFADRNGQLTGFCIKGHSMLAEHGNDVLCAFVSSAAYLAANTLTEISGVKAQAEADDGYMRVLVEENDRERSQDILAGLRLHLEETMKQYPENLKVIITEV